MNLSKYLLFFSVAFPAYPQNLSPEESKNFIREMFSKVIEASSPDDSVYSKYFANNYLQLVDGKALDFQGFVEHMKAQKKVLKRLKVTFRHLLVERNKIASVHLVSAEKFDGTNIQAQVNAVFEIENGKLTLCDELTRILKGSEEDADLGSRR